MAQPPYAMDVSRREAVLAFLRERCSERQWCLLAAHVRSNHVHIIVEAEVRPERVMNDLKSHASRWLWKRENVLAAIRYVVDQQGDPMAVFEAT